MNYKDIYQKRLNRYGLDYQSRIQNKREMNFEYLLLKSVYRVEFSYDGMDIVGCLEKYKQDNTETLGYLLTRVDVMIPCGTILMIPNKDNIEKPWMVYYLENMKASGYNRYIVLKMTHYITWRSREDEELHSWAYMYGQEDNMLKDEIRSRSRMDTIYGENLKMSFFVMPLTPDLKRDDYLEIGEGKLKEAYRVTGYDIQSTPGVEFVTVDPVYLRDHTPKPEKQETDSEESYYWLEKGGDLWP